MVRIRPRGDAQRGPDTVAGRPLEGEAVPPPALDDLVEVDELAGAEAFGPPPDRNPDDPFGMAAAEERRQARAERSAVAPVGLVVAIAVLVVGLLAILLGLADEDDDDVRSDDVATATSTTATTLRTSTTVRTTTSTTGGATTSTTSGFTPGTTPATAGPTVTTLRPTTTLTATTLPANQPLAVDVDVVMADDRSNDIVAGEPTDITVRLVDPDAVPSGNCLEVVVEGGLGEAVLADNACDTTCPSGAATSEPTGGTFENGFTFTFEEAGTYHVVVTATSGRHGCGNRYADRVDGVRSSPITVATAD
jgi:hypothetical protein